MLPMWENNILSELGIIDVNGPLSNSRPMFIGSCEPGKMLMIIN